MIYVYGQNEGNLTTLGICGALTPSQCNYTEAANGESVLNLIHPLDSLGKYKELKIGRILRAPVPVRNPPIISSGSGQTITLNNYTVNSDGQKDGWYQNAENRKLYADYNLSKALRYIPVGSTVEFIEHSYNSKAKGGAGLDVAKVIYGGYEIYCEYRILTQSSGSTVIPSAEYGIEQAASSYTVRDQLFRIKTVTADLNGVSVTAWHIFYDLAGNVTSYTSRYDTAAGTALTGILANCKADHDFHAYTNDTSTQRNIEWKLINPIKAMLDGEESFAHRYNLQLMRDNFDVFFVKDAGFDRGVWIEYGKNMVSCRRQLDSTNVVTRVIPVGTNSDGSDLLLDGSTPWVDADNIGDYPEPHIYVLRCSDDCRVGSQDEHGATITVSKARENMETEATAYLANGVNLVTNSLDVDFVAIGDDPRFAAYRQFENVFLWDVVHIRADHIMPVQELKISYVDWDVLNMRYNSVRLGSIDDIMGV